MTEEQGKSNVKMRWEYKVQVKGNKHMLKQYVIVILVILAIIGTAVLIADPDGIGLMLQMFVVIILICAFSWFLSAVIWKKGYDILYEADEKGISEFNTRVQKKLDKLKNIANKLTGKSAENELDKTFNYTVSYNHIQKIKFFPEENRITLIGRTIPVHYIYANKEDYPKVSALLKEKCTNIE